MKPLRLFALYVGLVLGMWTTPIELLRRAFFKGAAVVDASSSAFQFAGRTTLSSGSATVTVSTNQVNSDSLIQLTLQSASVNSGGLCVRSINPGNHFILGWADGGTRAFDVVAMWELKKAS